jgi:hypothetical protein
MEFIAKSMVSNCTYNSFIILTDPKLTLIIGFFHWWSLWTNFYFTSGFLIELEKRLKSNELRFTAISEAFGAAKEVKVRG